MMKSIGAIVLSLMAAVVWCLWLAAVGARARRVARLPIAPDLRLPVDFLLGSFALSSAYVIAGMLGAFRPGALLPLACILAVVGRYRGLARQARRLAPFAAATLILLPVAAAPPFFHDALVYHLGLPWQALQEGRLASHPEDLFSSFPPLFQMMAAGPLAAGLERLPALLHLASFVLAGQALAALSRRIGAPPSLAVLSGATLPLLPSGALVPALPAAEGFLAAPLLAALALALAGRNGRGGPLLAGLLAGIGVASRLQGIPWAAVVIAIIVLRARPVPQGLPMERRFGPGSVLRQAGIAGLGVMAGSLPWWLKNLVLLGDPLAPLGWRREGVETLWRDASSTMHLWSGAAGWLVGLCAALTPHLSYLAPLILASILSLVAARGSGRRAIACAAILGLLVWSLTGSLPRFLTPTLAVLLALAASSGGAGRIGVLTASLSLGVTAALGLAFTAGEIDRLGGPRLAIADPLAWPPALVVHNPAPAFAAARWLPGDARVLFIGETRGFGFPRRFVVPSQHDVSPLREPLETLPSAEAARDWLLGAGFTHLLVNRGELNRLAATHPVAPWRSEAGRKRFQDLLGLCTPPRILEGEVGIFALRPSQAHSLSPPGSEDGRRSAMETSGNRRRSAVSGTTRARSAKG